MTWKFYACVVIVLAYGAAVVWLKIDARRRIREEAEEKARVEAVKNTPPPPEWTHQVRKNPWDLTEEDLERRIRGS